MENDKLQSRREFFRKSVKLATLFVVGTSSLLVKANHEQLLGASIGVPSRDCHGTCKAYCKDGCDNCCRGTCGLACDGSCIALERNKRNRQVDSCRVDSTACKIDSCYIKNK